MNKILKGLLVAALAVSAGQVRADSTNKTFLMPRPVGVNLPMEWSSFHSLVNHKSEDRFGASIAVTGFYQASTNGEDIAEYFLVNNKSTIKLGRAGAAPDNAISPVQGNPFDVNLGYLIHESLAVAPQVDRSATMSLDPEQTAYGVRIDYHQCLGKLLKGLYFYANMPIAHVENDPELTIANASADYAVGVINAAAVPVKTAIESFFNGTFENTTLNTDLQSKLTKAKIAGERSETGVADIDLGLGYKFLNKEKYNAGIALAITIPTGDEADGEYMFDATVGNGGHFGLGGDLCAGAQVWGDMDHNIKLKLAMKYRYLFESDEMRTVGIKNGGKTVAFGQYYNLIPVNAGVYTQGTPLVPAANVTTLNLDITPGSQFDGVLGMIYNNGNFSFDLGYNMYYREAEEAELKGDFAENKYVIAARNFSTQFNANAGAIANAQVDGNVLADATLTKKSLDFSVAETPSQFTHSIYTGLGYCFKDMDTPVLLGLGGKYEWADENSALEQWGIWGKIGVGF